MPVGAGIWGPPASPGRGPMAPGWAMLVLLVLMLSSLWVSGVVPLPEPGLRRGARWVWGVSEQAPAEPPLPSRRKRDDGGQQPSATITAPEHGRAATAAPGGNETDSLERDSLPGSVPPAAPSTNTSLHRALGVPTTAQLLDETDSPAPDLLLSSAAPAAPSTNASLLQAPVVPTTAEPQDETDSPDPDLLSSAPPAPSTTRPLRALAVRTTAEPQDETDSPDPDLLSSAPPAPSTTRPLRALAVRTTTEPQDETDSPDLDLLPPSSVPPPVPSTPGAPQRGITTKPNWLPPPSEDETETGDADSDSATPPALNATTTASEEAKKAGATSAPTRDTEPWATTAPVPWELDRVMGKCLLAMLLLALVAATFMVCTGVLGALLWRRARTAQRRFSPTEMVCISSLLPDAEAAANGPKPGPARRHRPLLDGGFEADGDNLTLSSFLPEHS